MSDHSNSVKLGEIIQEFGLEILHPGANYASIPPDHSGREPSGPASDRLF